MAVLIAAYFKMLGFIDLNGCNRILVFLIIFLCLFTGPAVLIWMCYKFSFHKRIEIFQYLLSASIILNTSNHFIAGSTHKIGVVTGYNWKLGTIAAVFILLFFGLFRLSLWKIMSRANFISLISVSGMFFISVVAFQLCM